MPWKALTDFLLCVHLSLLNQHVLFIFLIILGGSFFSFSFLFLRCAAVITRDWGGVGGVQDLESIAIATLLENMFCSLVRVVFPAFTL